MSQLRGDRYRMGLRARSRTQRRAGRTWRLGAVAAAAVLASMGTVTLSTAGAVPAGAAAGAALTVTPSSGLIDGQSVSVVVTGASPGSVYVAAECDPEAFTLLADGESPQD